MGDGGRILFGIDPDETTVVGLTEDALAVRERLDRLIHDTVTPSDPIYDIRSTEVDGKLVVLLDIAPSPPLIALYQVTANVLRVKSGWAFAMNRTVDTSHDEAARIHADVRDSCGRLFRRAQAAGVLRPDADPDWTCRVFCALIHEAAAEAATDGADPDVLAARTVDTLLRGVGCSEGLGSAGSPPPRASGRGSPSEHGRS